MTKNPELFTCSSREFPESISEQELTDEESAYLQRIDDNLVGEINHSRLMLYLQKFVYEYRFQIEGLEEQHHDLVDSNNKIMTEVGTNAMSGNRLSGFLYRVFRFHYNRKNKNGICDWKHYYLNYDLELHKVEITEKGRERIIGEIEESKQAVREYQNSLNL